LLSNDTYSFLSILGAVMGRHREDQDKPAIKCRRCGLITTDWRYVNRRHICVKCPTNFQKLKAEAKAKAAMEERARQNKLSDKEKRDHDYRIALYKHKGVEL